MDERSLASRHRIEHRLQLGSLTGKTPRLGVRTLGGLLLPLRGSARAIRSGLIALLPPNVGNHVRYGRRAFHVHETTELTRADEARLVDQGWELVTPCGASAIVDAVVSTDYTLLDTEPVEQEHSTYQSQLSLIVKNEKSMPFLILAVPSLLSKTSEHIGSIRFEA